MTKTTNELDKLFTCYDDRFRQSYNSYRKVGQLMRKQGYDVACLNGTFEQVMNNVIPVWEKYYLDHCPCAVVESVTESSPEAVTEILVKPAKRDYPIASFSALHGRQECKASEFKGGIINAIEDFLSNELLLFPEVWLYWSQAA